MISNLELPQSAPAATGKRRKRRSVQVYKSGEIQTHCGFKDRGIKVLKDAVVDEAMKRFWDKRGMKQPRVDISYFDPSGSDVMDEFNLFPHVANRRS